MGQETVSELQEKQKQNLSCATNDASVSETVIVIPKEFPSSNNSCPTSSRNQLSDSRENNDKVFERKKEGKYWVVDVKCGDLERACRICHLSTEQELKASKMVKSEIIRLGCGCNGELGFAHLNCAETWFKLKGNRTCEICGETVDNVKGAGNDTFMEVWLENGATGNAPNSTERSQGCWHGQPFCNFLMACLVIAFVLPWFFRINMFRNMYLYVHLGSYDHMILVAQVIPNQIKYKEIKLIVDSLCIHVSKH